MHDNPGAGRWPQPPHIIRDDQGQMWQVVATLRLPDRGGRCHQMAAGLRAHDHHPALDGGQAYGVTYLSCGGPERCDSRLLAHDMRLGLTSDEARRAMDEMALGDCRSVR